MTYTTLSTKHQVVIPKEIRHNVDCTPGKRFLVLYKDGIIQLIPDLPATKLRGILKGKKIDSKNIRDKSDRPK